MPKVIALIPARFAATRFPGKLLKELEGKSIIRRTYEAVKNTQLFDQVIGACSEARGLVGSASSGSDALQSCELDVEPGLVRDHACRDRRVGVGARNPARESSEQQRGLRVFDCSGGPARGGNRHWYSAHGSCSGRFCACFARATSDRRHSPGIQTDGGS